MTSIQWLPGTIEFDKRTFFQFHPHSVGTDTYQFVSFSESGQVLFWDTRFNEKVTQIIIGAYVSGKQEEQ